MATSEENVTEDLPFPRGSSLPSNSPIFWAENKDRFLRQLMIRDIEALTNRPLGVYFAQRSMKSSISQPDLDRLHELIRELDVAPFDLIIETRGGETDAAEAMISLLLACRHPFRAIVPNRAKSNGTLLCLAAETIMMGPTSELGPIEPLVDDIPASALLETDAKQDGFDMFRVYAQYAMAQTKKVADRALRFRMLAGAETSKVDVIINALCGRTLFPSHGSVIDSSQAAEIGLKVEVVSSDDPVWQRVWLLYCMLRADSNLRGIVKFFESRRVSLGILNGTDND